MERTAGAGMMRSLRGRSASLLVSKLADVGVSAIVALYTPTAERAYRAGAISYLEWAQLQSERTAARRQQLEVALDAQRALIELQRLTGQPLLMDAASSTQGNLP